jgi:hypothetical protein
MIRRLAVAGALSLSLSLAIAPVPAAACSWVPPSLNEVAASADYVFVGVVTEVPAPQTYLVEVERVFRGAPPASMTFMPDPEEGLGTCMSLEAGERYVIGTDRVEGPLNVGQVWYHLGGEVANGIYLLNWTGTVDELLAELAALPDTSLPLEAPAPGLIRLTGMLLIGLAGGMLAVPVVRQLLRPAPHCRSPGASRPPNR